MVLRVRRKRALDEGMKAWIISTAKKNHWRVAAICDLEDLIQEGYCCYCRCRQKYRNVDSQAHFMSLVKITFINHIHSMSTKATRMPDKDHVDEGDVEERLGAEEESLTLAVLIQQLPTELKQLLQLLSADGREAPLSARIFLRKSPRIRENTNEHWCRLLGLDPTKYDLEGSLRGYLLS